MLCNLARAGALALFASQALALSPHEKISQAPAGWSVASTPAPTTQMTLQVALVLQNIDEMIAQLYAVSTPGSPTYGQHLDNDAVNAMVAPSSAAHDAVMSWLQSAGITTITSDGSIITFTTDVASSNKLLSTQFLYYVQDGVQKLRTTQYTIPESVQAYIDFVTPTTFFGTVKPQGSFQQLSVPATSTTEQEVSKRALAAACHTSITPACLKQLYSVTYTPSADSGSKVGFGSFLNQSARRQDLSLYEAKNQIPAQQYKNVFINAAENVQKPNANVGEANLDVQNIIGVSNPLPVTQFLTGGSPPFHPDPTEPTQNENEPYLPYYQFLSSQKNADLPQVISNSYGEDEQTVPEKYAIRVCNMIAMMGLRGITIFESSGDEGVGAGCISTDGKNTPQFNPIFPATCPYLTSVGGTQSVEPEIAWIGSSGGFSYYFPRPSYQTYVIADYLNNKIAPSTLAYYQPYFNQNGRGFPDVSAHSVAPDYQVYYNNQLSPSGGTSAASPVLAAIFAMVNDALLKNGKPVLGWLNPFLYKKGTAGFTDITKGGSIGCNGNNTQTGQPVPGQPIIPYASWNATIGWDPVTGLGTPNLTSLLQIALS